MPIRNEPEARRLWGARTLASVGLMVWLCLHVYWALRTEINWDEFALLARASDSLREGRLLSGGRPGLATLLLMPLVDGCTDALSVVRHARLWWTPFTLGILGGLWLTLFRLFSDRVQAASNALIGVSLLALTPNFMRFSVQLRTDQPAIAMGLLAGALLIGSRRHLRTALLAGVLFGVGYLFSQKLVYVAALVGILAAGDLVLKADLQLRREFGRILAVAGGFLVVLVAYRVLVSLVWEPPSMIDVGRQMNVFRFYRDTMGYQYYWAMLPRMLGLVGLLAALLILLPSAVGRGGTDRILAILSVAVLALGVAVGRVHAGAFPYFWMTLGLFPAIALAIGLPFFMRLPKWTRRRVLVPFWVVFTFTIVYVGAAELRDGQEVQRETLEFVSANFSPDLEGFQATRALFCRDRHDPLPTFFSQNIRFRFWGEGGPAAVEQLIVEFRQRPVGFLIQSFRLQQFPESMRRFWDEHYVPYSGAVHLAGTSIDETDPVLLNFEVLVPGAYAFYSSDSGASIRIGTTRLGAGDTIRLERGFYTIDRSQTSGSALFALAIPEQPGPVGESFYQVF